MLRFKEFIKEDISTGSFKQAMLLIMKYLSKKTRMQFFPMAGTEEYKDAYGKGVGVRFMCGKGQSIRFNWKSMPSSSRIMSVDYWDGTSKDKATTHLSFARDVSLVKILPVIADIINTKGNITGRMYTIADGVPLDEATSVNSQLIVEAKDSDIYTHIVELMQAPNFSKGIVYNLYKGTGNKIFDAIVTANPDVLVKVGSKYSFAGTPADIKAILADRDNILQQIGVIEVKASRGSKQSYEGNKEIDKLENNRNRLTYEKQLQDLENLVKMVVAGASNALFVAGRGGIGKTHTVEAVMHSLGLSDGNGYFKNTGSASAAGIYALLFKHKDEIVFFDDSDDALKDQEARNIFKAATDTKKVRKLVWNKMGKNVVDPDEMTDDEILDQGLIPRFFEFTGKVIFISNLKMDKLDPDGALRTRAFMIEIDPTEVEVYDFMESIVDKIPIGDGLSLSHNDRVGVIGLLRKGTSKQTANLRKLSRALNMKAGAVNNGVSISDSELSRMIEYYA